MADDNVSAPSGISADHYEFLKDYVQRASGIVLDGDKRYLIEARLAPIVRQRQLGSLTSLCALLRATTDEPLKQEVIDAMTTNETLFFRDTAQYDALKSVVIPALVQRNADTRRLRFWSAACSSGQEAYSLAMMLLEMGLSGWNIEILGTDLSSRMLERARAGRYLQIEVNRGLPPAYLTKYFQRAGLDWQIREDVRRMVEFRPIDLRHSMSTFGPFDVVFCRNVLIYFDPEAKKRILREIRGTLCAGGHLLLGGSEGILGLNEVFEPQKHGSAVLYLAR